MYQQTLQARTEDEVGGAGARALLRGEVDGAPCLVQLRTGLCVVHLGGKVRSFDSVTYVRHTPTSLDNQQSNEKSANLEAEALEGVVLDVIEDEVHAVAVPAVVHRVLRLSYAECGL